MTLEVNQIKASSEAAIGSNAEKPNFTEVYKELSNNTTAQEQKAERTAFNEVLHQRFPSLDLVGQDQLKSAQGQKDALVVFDRTNNHVQLRSAEDFSVVGEKDMTAKVEENKVTSEQASEFLASVFDKAIEEKANANSINANGSPESLPPASDQTAPPSSEKNVEQKKDVTDQANEKTYVVEKGDCLWNIAKAELKAAHDQSGEVTNASIRNYVDKIVERNREEIKNEDLIYPGQKFILPSLKQPDEKQKLDGKQKPEEKANTGEKPTAQTGDGTTSRLDAPLQSRPDAPTEPNNENIFDDKRNSVPDQPASKM